MDPEEIDDFDDAISPEDILEVIELDDNGGKNRVKRKLFLKILIRPIVISLQIYTNIVSNNRILIQTYFQ